MQFYHNRPGFSYLKYLEQKSHFSGLEISIRNDIKSIISSSRDLEKSKFTVVKNANAKILEYNEKSISTMESGFINIGISINNLRMSVDNLASLCEIGFSAIDLQLSDLNNSVHELVKISKSPDKTWAFEQFETARDAYRRNLYEEALEYINRAIDGYGNRSGYKLEYRFHILRGKIRLGNEKNFDPDIVNLDFACSDFLNAAKYSKHDCNIGFSNSLKLAGWASYCSGKVSEAESFISESLEVYPKLETKFLLSKILLHQGNVKTGFLHFAEVIRKDINFALRAGGDPDFLKYDLILKEEIKAYREFLVHKIENHSAQYNKLNAREKIAIISGYVDTNEEKSLDLIDAQISNTNTAPITEILTIESELSKSIPRIQRFLSDAKITLLSKASAMDAQPEPIEKGLEPQLFAMFLAGAVGIVCFIAAVVDGFSTNFVEGFLSIFGGAIFGVMIAVPVWICAAILAKMYSKSRQVADSLSAGSKNKKNAAILRSMADHL